MHSLLPIGDRAGSWSPRLSPLLVRLCRPLRHFIQRRVYRISSINVSGIEQLKSVLDQNCGVLLACNHVTCPDPFLLNAVADLAGRPLYFMTAWQVFGTSPWIKQQVLRRLGCFSVDREGTDLRAFRTAIDILASRSHPLVVFPEGEMYHTNDRVMPFHEGAASMLLTAARKSDRPVVCVPCALRYDYQTDPTPQLTALLDRMERRFFWRPDHERSLTERIDRLAQAALALKEIEHLGQTRLGTVADRVRHLCTTLLGRLEQQFELRTDVQNIPQRVKRLRQKVISQLVDLAPGDPRRLELQNVLDDVFLAVQLFSYPYEYLAESPTVERIAETIDKLEEDVLGVPHATVRGTRRASVVIGEPIPIESRKDQQPSVSQLTETIESRVQGLLDGLVESSASAS